MRSRRSSNGVRFQRLQRGQTTHNRPLHSSNAIRRPTPSPEGPPSPSNAALQNAQLLNMLGSKSLRGERSNLYFRGARAHQISDDLTREAREQHAVAAVAGGVPQPSHVWIGSDDRTPVGREGAQAGPGAGWDRRQLWQQPLCGGHDPTDSGLGDAAVET